MAKVSPIFQNFNAGEFSPLLYGRTDIAKYKNALALCKNYVPMIQGGITRRPGTYFAAEVKDSTAKTRLVRFEFSTTQAYIIEFGNEYCRFFMDDGQILDGADIYEITTPYLTAELFELEFTQSADVLYIAHPGHAPRKLSRSSHTDWTLSTIAFIDGPYLAVNTTATTLTPGATTGSSVTVTASATTGINDDEGFLSSDVGRLIRIGYSDTWGYGTITAITSTKVCTVKVDANFPFGGTTAVATWRLGLWSDTTGYPAAVTFFEDRLCWGGTTTQPQRIDGSRTSDYETYSPTEIDGTLADDNAITFALNANDVNVIRWMLGDEKGLLIGTVGGEWIMRPTTAGGALTPRNVDAKQSTSYGSAYVQPIRAGRATLFVQRAGRKVRELTYQFEVDGFVAPDISLLSEHITLGGVTAMAYQQEPHSVLWAVRGDGVLLSVTYDREQQVVGWAKHVLGGAFGTGDPVVESVAVIPASDGTRDELWLIVKLTIDAATKRYVCYMPKFFEQGDDQEDAFFVDCGLTFDGDGTPATTISGLDHLEGETVQVLADGAAHPDVTVDGGAITLVREATVVQVGLGYNSDAQTLRIDAGAADGTAQGKTKRIHHMTVRLHESLGLKMGPDADNLDTLVFRTSGNDTSTAVPLFSGDFDTDGWGGDYDLDGQIYLRQDQPLPSTILAIMPQLVTSDRG